jgi:hypothetical protein
LSSSATGEEVLRAAQRAVDCAAGYRIIVRGHNLVLPLWGGIDDATVDVNADGTATASVQRTGDGEYLLVFRNGQTFYRRRSCDHWSRRSGGGGAIFDPFLWTRTRSLEQAGDARIMSSGQGAITVAATIAPLGPLTLTVDMGSARPSQLAASQQSSGTITSWTFDNWGRGVDLPAVAAPTPDGGPGGNPC